MDHPWLNTARADTEVPVCRPPGRLRHKESHPDLRTLLVPIKYNKP